MTEILLTVFATSLLGSLHCVGMCGGFVAFYSSAPSGHGQGPEPRGTQAGVLQWGPHAAYNLGRFATYTTLGAVAGAVGSAVNLAGEASGVGHVAALVCGVLIIAWGALMLVQAAGAPWARTPAPLWLNKLLGRILTRLRAWPAAARAAVLGVSSALLPCGWLYAFAATAAGTGSAAGGASVMAAFWLGTVPAMVGVGLGVHRLAKALGPRLGLLMPLMLIVMGIFTVVQRGFAVGASHAVAAAAGVPS